MMTKRMQGTKRDVQLFYSWFGILDTAPLLHLLPQESDSTTLLPAISTLGKKKKTR